MSLLSVTLLPRGWREDRRPTARYPGEGRPRKPWRPVCACRDFPDNPVGPACIMPGHGQRSPARRSGPRL